MFCPPKIPIDPNEHLCPLLLFEKTESRGPREVSDLFVGHGAADEVLNTGVDLFVLRD